MRVPAPNSNRPSALNARVPARRSRALLVSSALAVVAVLVALAPAVLASDPASHERGGPTWSATRGLPSRSLTVTHGPVQTTLTTAGSDGHQLGDMRVTSLPLAADGAEGEVGRLDASLLTTSIDAPNPGDEFRISTLIFTLGEPADQVVVTGSGLYPAAGSTIAIDSVIVRPIVGGSGRFAGVTGWAESEHLADDTWRHALHFSGLRPLVPGSLPRIGPSERGERGGRSERPDRPMPTPVAGIVRTLLGETQPATAEGRTLALWHYSIAPGEELVPHTHPGYQVARIVTGSLRYEVISGDVQIVRADGSTESLGSGGVVTLEAGDTVIENPDLVHFGANDGWSPVVILTATLFDTGAEPATPVQATEVVAESPAPAASPAGAPVASPAG